MLDPVPPVVPPGIIIERVLPTPDRILLVARTENRSAACPACGVLSSRVHSCYQRRLADLPWHGRRVALELRVRRLRCSTVTCPQRIFAERLPAVMPVRVRRTTRLRTAQQQIAFTAGGEPGSRLARRLAMPVSGDTLLRLIRAAAVAPSPPPRVIGIDDWAFRRGQSYGTIVCDLERGRVIDLLPNREADTVATWLKQHPSIERVARDRAGAYAEGARSGAPQAVQVADRWHLLRNLSDALQGLVERHRRPVRKAARLVARQRQAERVSRAPPALSKEQQLRSARRQEREKRFAAMQRLNGLGLSTVQVGAHVGVSSLTVQRWLKAGGPPSHNKPPQPGNLDAHTAYLERRWRAGCRNATLLWRELRGEGYGGGERTVRRWAARRRRTGAMKGEVVDAVAAREWPAPSNRCCARWLATPSDQLDAAERAFLAHLGVLAPRLVQAGELARAFADLVRRRPSERPAAAALEAWLEQAQDSLLEGYARGLERDRQAVEAALAECWSTGPVEGHINRLKALKRQMYGRAQFDLLRTRVLLPA